MWGNASRHFRATRCGTVDIRSRSEADAWLAKEPALFLSKRLANTANSTGLRNSSSSLSTNSDSLTHSVRCIYCSPSVQTHYVNCRTRCKGNEGKGLKKLPIKTQHNCCINTTESDIISYHKIIILDKRSIRILFQLRTE